jgi:very-short-patch-repair endonuclease
LRLIQRGLPQPYLREPALVEAPDHGLGEVPRVGETFHLTHHARARLLNACPVADERSFRHHRGAGSHVRDEGSTDEVIARLASSQHGIVARSELLVLGIGRRAIACRLALGRLRPVHPGVYAVGHDALAYPARVLAAVMSVAPAARRESVAGGDRANRSPIAAASHAAAAALFGLRDPPHGPIDVSVDAKRATRIGIAVHRAALAAEEVTLVDGVPVTTIERTLLDLSAVTPAGPLRRLVKQAEFRGLTDFAAVAAILRRHPRRQGRRTLADIVERYADTGKTRSELEDRFLQFCARRGLPLPQTNVVLDVRGERVEVDCAWPAARIVVELDGRVAHGRQSSFHDDRARDRALLAAGWIPMRVTWPQLHNDGDTLEREIRDVLDVASGRRSIGHQFGA